MEVVRWERGREGDPSYERGRRGGLKIFGDLLWPKTNNPWSRGRVICCRHVTGARL